MGKDKAIEVVKNLTNTIEKLNNIKGRVVKEFDNEMFSAPSASKHALNRKRKEIIDKYNLKEKEYGATKREG